jgi:phage tail sheath protein FI
MTDALYVHGIIINQATGEAQEIRSPSSSVVGIVGTAPQSKDLKANVPAAFLGKKAALDAIYPEGSKGDKGSLHGAVIGVQEQGLVRMVLVRSESDKQADIIKAIEALPSAKSVTGHKPKILIVPGLGNTITSEVASPPAVAAEPTTRIRGA